jgi:hypothetical protein
MTPLVGVIKIKFKADVVPDFEEIRFTNIDPFVFKCSFVVSFGSRTVSVSLFLRSPQTIR